MSRPIRSPLFAALLFSATSTSAQLNGTYTVGPSGTYATLAAAITDLQTNGVSGPVFMDILSGTYTGTWTINTITGTSAMNRVTFRAQSLVPSDVTLANAANTPTITFNGCSFITLEALTVTGGGNVIQLNSTSPDVIIRNCALTGSGPFGVGVSAGNARPDRLLVEGCIITAPYIGVTMSAPAGQRIVDPVLRDNVISGVNLYGVYLRLPTGVLVEDNTISSSGVNNGTYLNGIDVRDADGVITIRGNKVEWGLGSNALYVEDCIWPSGSPPRVENNMFSLSGGNTAGAAVSVIGTDGLLFRHNSVRSTLVRHALQVQFCDDVVVEGNILETTADEVLMTQSATFASIDHNVYYCTQANVVRWSVFTYYGWTAWQGLGWDPNSVFADPLFAGPTDLHIQAGSPAQELGPLPFAVTVDRDGEARGTPATLLPDAGADERTDACVLGLQGAYGVGPSPGNIFPTLTDAISTLVGCGVVGPVIMEIESGTYTGNWSVPAITGSSAINTITFRSAAVDSVAVVLQPSDPANPVFIMNGCSFVTLSHVRVAATNHCVRLANGTSDCRVMNCSLANTSTTGMAVQTNSTAATRPVVINNRITGAQIGINLTAPSGQWIVSPTITGNVLENIRQQGVQLFRVDGFSVEGNTVGSTGTNTTINYRGINIENGRNGGHLARNRVNWGQGGAAIRIDPLSVNSADPLLVENNMAVYSGTHANGAAVHMETTDHIVFRHNSTRSLSDRPAFWSQNSLSLNVTGNIFQTGFSVCARYDGWSYTALDRNVYWCAQVDVISTNTVPTAWVNWQDFNREGASIFADPLFVSATDLHILPGSPALSRGVLPTTLGQDLDGEARSLPFGSRPDAGADEIGDGCTGLSGTYVLGPSVAADFPTFRKAVDVLHTCGIAGPTVLLVESGTYVEQFWMLDVLTTSPTNTITFRGLAGDSSAVSLQWPAAANNVRDHVVRMTGMDHVRFERMTIERTGSGNFGNVVVFSGSAPSQDIKLQNARLMTTPHLTAGKYLLVNNQNGGDSTVVRNTRLVNARYPIRRGGSGAAGHLVVDGCVFAGSMGTAIDVQNDGGAVRIVRNTMEFSPVTTGLGINLLNKTTGYQVARNRIFLGGATDVGIAITACAATNAAQGLVQNNMVRTGGLALSLAGSSPWTRIDFNTLVGGTAALSITAATVDGLSVRNNILATASGATFSWIGSGSTGMLASHNVLHKTGGAPLAIWNTAQNTLAALQGASGLFTGSLSTDPRFFDPAADLHIYAMEADAAAVPIAGIAEDHDGQPRDPTSPDIGADEFRPELWNEINNTCGPTDPITSAGTGTDQWIYKDRKVVARFNDNGQVLGTVNMNVYVNNGPVRQSLMGHYYMDRNWQLITQNAISPGAIVRLFHSGNEFATYAAADPVVNVYADAGVAHYVGLMEDCDLMNNPIGNIWTPIFPASPALEPRIQSNGGTHGYTAFVGDDGELYITNMGAPLPVELLSFTGERVSARDVDLAWSTATEHNNAGFEVWRMVEGEADFTEVGWVDGAGDAQQRTDYAFTDANDAERTSFYKLKQVDHDGQHTWTPVIAVAGAPAMPDLVIHPNPATDLVQVNGAPEGTRFALLDAAGRMVRDWSSSPRIDQLGDLDRGCYAVVVARADGERSVVRVVLQ